MPKRYTSAELIKMIKDDGWILECVNGSRHHFYHPVKKGIVTIPHPVKDMDPKTTNSIQTASGRSQMRKKQREAIYSIYQH